MVTVNFWRGYLRRIEVASGKKMNARNKETLGFFVDHIVLVFVDF